MKCSRHRSSGIAAVESLIVLPIIFLIFAAIIEFGTAFVRFNILNKAVQNAVRYSVIDVYGTLDPDTIANKASIKNLVIYGQKQIPSGDNINRILDSITIENVEVNIDGGYVVVTATYTYKPLLKLLSINAGLTFSSSSVMRTM